jgi:hypothetical protein
MEQIETVIAALERAPEIIIPLVYEVPQAILKRRPKPGKWSAHEHACHMAEVHSMIFPRLDYILTDPHPVITPYFPSSHEEGGTFLKVNLGEAMSRFAADRRGLVGRLKELSPEQWSRTAAHGEYSRYSVFIMFRHLAMHDMFHAYRIEELLLKKDWS